MKKQPRKLASARSYYRLAVKAAMAGNHRQAETYRRTADRLVREYRAGREAAARIQSANRPTGKGKGDPDGTTR